MFSIRCGSSFNVVFQINSFLSFPCYSRNIENEVDCCANGIGKLVLIHRKLSECMGRNLQQSLFTRNATKHGLRIASPYLPRGRSLIKSIWFLAIHRTQRVFYIMCTHELVLCLWQTIGACSRFYMIWCSLFFCPRQLYGLCTLRHFA